MESKPGGLKNAPPSYGRPRSSEWRGGRRYIRRVFALRTRTNNSEVDQEGIWAKLEDVGELEGHVAKRQLAVGVDE